MIRQPSPAAFGQAAGLQPLESREFDQIRRLAYRVSGLDLKPGKEELVSSRLGKLARAGGFGSFGDYYRHVLEDKSGESLVRMIDALTTNHTAFNREPEHFEFLRANVLPGLASRETIEAWSAASSTGEEVWTLACLLNDSGVRRPRLVASDISTRALEAAERGIYPLDRCAGLPAAWLSRYFEPVGRPPQAYRVKSAVRAQATFRRLNLIEPFSWTKTFPIIFCRNVMIYFDSATQERVVRHLTGCLEPGGYLFVGHAESLTRVAHGLEYIRPAVYRKPAGRRRA